MLGDVAPDFIQDSIAGKISFHRWLGDSWGVLFSHPKGFTPVCTTELGATAKLNEEFAKRNVKLLGIRADDVNSHNQWVCDIAETQGTAVNFPILGDPDVIKQKYPKGYKALKPYLRMTPQPNK